MGTTKTKPWLLFVLLLILSCCTACFSIAGNTLSAGQSLSFSKNETILSQSGTFELGFFTPGSPVKIYLGIWYKWFVPREVVWVANRENPLSDPSSSRLDLSEDGSLLLFEGSSKIPFWSSNLTFRGSNITEAVLRDDGNFVLRNRSNMSSIFWESFNHPTDTWLPGAKLGVDKLISWKNSEDPAPGVFSLGLDPNGSSQYFLEWNRSQNYWSSGVWNGKIFSLIPEMNAFVSRENVPFSSIFTFTFVPSKNGSDGYLTYSLQNPSYLSKYRVDYRGQWTLRVWMSGPWEWTSFWTAPGNLSDVFALCGAFGVVQYPENYSTPCQCLKGFEPFSINYTRLNDWRGGCVRKSPLQCENNTYANGKNEGFLKIQNMRLPSKAYLPTGARVCEVACISDCSCTAFTYNSSGCMIWEGALFNLQQRGTTGQNIYLKLAIDEYPDPGTKGRMSHVSEMKSMFRVELIVILVILIRQKMESMDSCAGSCNRTYLMPRHLFFNQKKAQIQG
jgi:hypothetical protein